MTVPLALDLTRLALGPVRHSPRGIDRVEMAYARHFLQQWPEECVAVLPTMWGVRCFDRERALRGLNALDNLWRESADPFQDSAYLQTKSFLDGTLAASSLWPRNLTPTFAEKATGFMQLLSAAGFSFGRSIGRTLPKGSIYLNVGQLEVFRPFMSWLGHRPDVCSVFMIHDVIPIELPEYHLRIGVRSHESILKNTAEFAKALIVPSHSVRGSVCRELSRYGRMELPVHVELLPVPSEFVGEPAIAPELLQSQYFIVCGVIDSYKNHMLLLKVWQDIASRHGEKTPKLVIAGSPGVTSQPVLKLLESDSSLRKHVILSSGLSTPALRRLIAGARALLMPSIAEGFGLPIVEALAQGTPVIASDISAHREAGAGGNVIYLPPTDSAEWIFHVEAMSNASKVTASALARPYQPKLWADYFTGIESYLSELVRQD